MNRYMCPVCGFDQLADRPYLASGKPSYEYCDCCAYQFGYTDGNKHISHQDWRERWVEAGMPWDWGQSAPPTGWDPVEQLKKLDAHDE